MGSEMFENYIRVSEILSYFGKLGKCEECNKNKAGIDAVVLQNKANIGSDVHELIEMYLKGVDYPPSFKTKGYFNSFKKWKEQMGEFKCHLEKRLFSDNLKLTGQIDCLIEENSSIYLIDFKTSYYPDVVSWSLQAAFYHILLIENKNIIYENLEILPRATFLHLKKNGDIAEEFTWEITDKITETAMDHYKVFKHRNLEKFENNFE